MKRPFQLTFGTTLWIAAALFWIIWATIFFIIMSLFVPSASAQLEAKKKSIGCLSGVAPTAPDLLPPGVGYHWDYTNLANGAVSDWVDNVNGLHWVQATGGNQPTKDSSGVTFDGTDDFLTGTNLTTGPTNLWLVIMKPNATTAGKVILGNALSGGQLFLGINSTGCFYENGLGDAICGTGTSTFDFLEANTTNAVAFVAYTNGVVAWTNATSWNNGVPISHIGSGVGNGFWSGVLKEVIVWTNATFTVAQVASIHSYATNRYGYTP